MELRGPGAIRHQIAVFLAAELAVRIPAVRALWLLSEEALPVPASDAYYAEANTAADQWPMIAVTSGRMSTRGTDFEDGQPQFRSTYPIRIYGWVRANGYQETADMRDDLATVLRMTVLSRVNLGTPGWLVAAPSTLVVDPSQIFAVKGDRFVAASYVGFDVHATETLTDRLATPNAPSRRTVADVRIAGTLLPPPPALP